MVEQTYKIRRDGFGRRYLMVPINVILYSVGITHTKYAYAALEE